MASTVIFDGRLNTGLVLSMLIPLAAAGALVLPARSVHVPEADCPAPSVLNMTDAEQDAIPDPLSDPPKDTVTSVLFQPFPFGAGDLFAPAVGALLSILIPDCVLEEVFPARSVQVPVED